MDEGALASFRGVLSASLFISASPCSFISSSEPSESLSRLLSDSAGDSSVTIGNREREQNDILISIPLTTKPYNTDHC